jgi:hypothetical protein
MDDGPTKKQQIPPINWQIRVPLGWNKTDCYRAYYSVERMFSSLDSTHATKKYMARTTSQAILEHKLDQAI